MKVQLGGRAFLAAAVASAVAVVAVGFLISLGVHSVGAGPNAAPPVGAPTPVGHEWSQVEGHGTATGRWWLGTTAFDALELRVNNGRVLRLEPNANSPNIIGGYSGNTVTTGAYGATICGGGYTADANSVTDIYGTVCGGRGNQAALYATVGGGSDNTASGLESTVGGGEGNTASASRATIAGGGRTNPIDPATGNRVTDNYGTVGGGGNNQAGGGGSTIDQIYATVSGGKSNTASASYATVSGGTSNTASASYATIAGGGESTPGTPATANRVTDDYGTVGGGGDNQAGDDTTPSTDESYATVGGGENNMAAGWYATVAGGNMNRATASSATVGGGTWSVASGSAATVGGGAYNDAGGEGAAVCGGMDNWADGNKSVVGGGFYNGAGGEYSMVPGGYLSIADGDYSFAAGKQAKANNQGCFVWSDNSSANDFTCSTDYRFMARAAGGLEFYSKSDLSTYCKLPASSGTWSCSSSADIKANFTPVDGHEVLASLAEMPITTWNFKAEDASIRHMGPVAQDFYAAFGLGEGDTSISTIDLDGVSLAAIQGLYTVSQEQASRIDALEEENATLQQRLDDLEARLTALKGGVGTSAASAESAFPGLSPWWLALLGGLVVVGLVLAQRRLAGGRS